MESSLIKNWNRTNPSNIIDYKKKINEYCSIIDTEDEKYDILLVDDDPLTIMVLTDFFELKGYSCKGIKNGTQALDHLKRIKPKISLKLHMKILEV